MLLATELLLQACFWGTRAQRPCVQGCHQKASLHVASPFMDSQGDGGKGASLGVGPARQLEVWHC